MAWHTRGAGWLALCSVVVAGALGDEPPARPKARVEFRWLESKPIPGVTEEKGIHVSESDVLSYPHKKPILTNEDIVEVRVSKTDFSRSGGLATDRTLVHYMLHFHLTPAALGKLAENCGKSGEKMLTASVDGRHCGAPFYIRSRDKANFVPYAGFFTSKSEVKRILAAFPAIPPVDGDANSGAENETGKPAAGSMQITVLGPDRKPLAGAKLHAHIGTNEPFPANRDYVCDAQGKATVELPKTINFLQLWATKEAHVSLVANWEATEEAKAPTILREYTFRLPKGTVIGGTVKNEQGEPIAGVKVAVLLVDSTDRLGLYNHPVPATWLADLEPPVDTRRTTDALGRWTLDTAPAGDAFGFMVKLSHPDYISDSTWGGLQKEQNVTSASLRERTGTIVMHRGARLSGVIVDTAANVVPDAVVIWGDDPYMQHGSQEVRTDANGHYQFPLLPVGKMNVTVVAPGWAPHQQLVNLAPGSSTANFELKPGKRLRLRFVDDAGAAVPGVGVSIDRWRGGKALYNYKTPELLDAKIPIAADKNGVYEWTWAPDDEVTFRFYKSGDPSVPKLKFTADSETEYVITVAKSWEVRKRPLQK